MKVFAIGDLHLPGGRLKPMDVFGENWRDHAERIAADWDARAGDDDLVLIPGDFSWAMRLPEAEQDIAWLRARPGVKVLIRGNHDYWWSSLNKVREALGPTVHPIQNSAFVTDDGRVAVAGSRLWIVPGLALGSIFTPRPKLEGEPGERRDRDEDERIYRREMHRLDLSLQQLPDSAKLRIAMLHFPPTNPDLDATPVTELLERRGVDLCIFGHLHNMRPDARFAGERDGIRYELVSGDYTGFRLAEVAALDVEGVA